MHKTYSVKNYLKNRLAYDWWKYVVVILAVCLLWYYAFYLTDRLKPTERIQIFTSAEIVDLGIEKELEDAFAGQGILDYFFYRASSENKYFDMALSTQGFENSDILIIPASSLTDDVLVLCAVFDESMRQHCLSANDKVSFLESGGNTYGVRIWSGEDEAYNGTMSFGSWLQLDGDYCMVLSGKSKNIGRLSPQADDENDKAIGTYLYLLGRK